MHISEAMKKSTPGPLKLNWFVGTRFSVRGKKLLRSISPTGFGKGTVLAANYTQDYNGQVWEDWLMCNPIDAALLAHWYNVGPKLLKALKGVERLACDPVNVTGIRYVREYYKSVIAEAEEVQGI